MTVILDFELSIAVQSEDTRMDGEGVATDRIFTRLAETHWHWMVDHAAVGQTDPYDLVADNNKLKIIADDEHWPLVTDGSRPSYDPTKPTANLAGKYENAFEVLQ